MSKSKIVEIEKLAEILEKEKRKGRKIVQCHGCFDLLHPGHIKHFEAARKMGDILVVTLTPDRYVNKGPGRPVYNERLRAETISSIGVVDYVAINKWPDAEKTIKLLKPSYYVKGQEYKSREDDITGKIYDEEAAVKSVGGEMRFTEEVTFTSTGLINQFFQVLSNEADGYLKQFRAGHTMEEVSEAIDRLGDMQVLVAGDIIIDDYTFCKAMGMTIKSPIISARELRTERYAGGVLAVANHVSNFVKKVHLVATWGGEPEILGFIKSSISPNVELHLIENRDAPTVVKRRFIEQFNNQKMLEISKIKDDYISSGPEAKVMAAIIKLAPKCDATLVADFGHGFITPKIVKTLGSLKNFVAVNVQTNSANYGFNMVTKYSGPDYLCLDERELRLPLNDRFSPVEDCINRISKATKCGSINVTLGKSGSLYYCKGKFNFVPVFSSDVVDSVGAGDAVFSITALLAAKNVDPSVIPFIGNCVGGLKVRILGNKDSVHKVNLMKFMGGLLK